MKLTEDFNRQVFEERAGFLEARLAGRSYAHSSACQKLESIFALFMLRDMERKRLESVQQAAGPDEDLRNEATEERLRLTKAQADLLLRAGHDVPALLKEAGGDAALDDAQRANLRMMDRLYRPYSLMADPGTAALIERRDRIIAKAGAIMDEARAIRENEGASAAFRFQLPYIEDVCAMQRELGKRMAERWGGTAYDAMLGLWGDKTYERDVAPAIEGLKEILPGLLDKIAAAQAAAAPPASLPSVPVEKQMALARELAEVMFAAGGWPRERRDKENIHIRFRSEGGSLTGSNNDMIVSGEIDENNPVIMLRAFPHEIGHALRLLQFNAEHPLKGQPVTLVHDTDIDETAASAMERALASPEAFRLLMPLIRKHWGDDPAFTPENLYRHYVRHDFENPNAWTGTVQRVTDSIAWTETEKAVFDGTITVAEMPGHYKKAIKDLVGLDAGDVIDFWDSYGYLVDNYWGYNICYALPELMAPHLAARAEKLMRDNSMHTLEDRFRAFADTARSFVFGPGARYTPAEMQNRIAVTDSVAKGFVAGVMKQLHSTEMPKAPVVPAPSARPASSPG